MPVSSVSQNGATFSRNNINKYYGCDTPLDPNDPKNKITKRSFIDQAYKDTLRVADFITPFLPADDGGLFTNSTTGNTTSTAPRQPGALERRYFGADIRATHEPKPTLIRSIFFQNFHWASSTNHIASAVIFNIRNWYPWPIFDWIGGKRIEVSCVDLPNKKNTKCITKVGNEDQVIGAYALSENGAQIVFCDTFFQMPHLDAVEKSLRNNPRNQKDLNWMKSSAHIMFHEMTHLTIITQTKNGMCFTLNSFSDFILTCGYEVVVLDQLVDPVGKTSTTKSYGPRLCEKLARRFPAFAGNNGINRLRSSLVSDHN
jgi:hypothetical protein